MWNLNELRLINSYSQRKHNSWCLVEHIHESFHYSDQSLQKHNSKRSKIWINEALSCVKCYWWKLTKKSDKKKVYMKVTEVCPINRLNKYADDTDFGRAGNQISGSKI